MTVFNDYIEIIDFMYNEIYREMNNCSYDDLRYQIEYSIGLKYQIVGKNDMLLQSMFHEIYLYLMKFNDKENM